MAKAAIDNNESNMCSFYHTPPACCSTAEAVPWSHGESNPDLSLAKAPFYR